MRVLVFDTETTGFVSKSLPVTHPKQPRMVQLGAYLFEEGKVGGRKLNFIVKPDGWRVPMNASNVHGITTERAASEGVPVFGIIAQFCDMAKNADVLVGHNIDFDRVVVSGECERIGFHFPKLPLICTMHASTDVLKIKKARGGFKWPNLTEAYEYAFGEVFDGAHDAFADVMATARVYSWLRKEGHLLC